MDVAVQVLGPVEVRAGGVRLDASVLSSAQVRLVLTAVALHPSGLTRERLTDVLWDQDLPASADAALRNVLSRVRRLLASLPGVSLLEEQGVLRLDPPPEVDLVQARLALDRAARLLDQGRLEEAAGTAERASAGLGRPVLAGVHAPWAEQLRRDVGQAAVRALLVRARVHLARREAAAAAELAGAALQAEPLLEAAHEVLVRAHVLGGNRALALQAYALCRQVLADGLGTSPGETLQALYLSLLTDDRGQPPPLRLEELQGRLNRIRHEEGLVALEARRAALDRRDPRTTPVLLDLLVALGRARWGSSRPAPQVLEVALEAGHLALSAGSALHAGQALDLLATSTGVGRSRPDVGELAERVRARWPDRLDLHARGLLLAAESDQGPAAVRSAEQAVSAARDSGDPVVLLDALLTLDRSLAWTPLLGRRLAIAHECDDLLAAGVPRWRVRPTYEPATRAQQGDRGWVDAHAAVQQTLADVTGQWEPAFYARAYRATSALLQGDVGTAGELADQLFAETREDVNSVNTAAALQLAVVRERGGVVELLPALAHLSAANPSIAAFAAAEALGQVVARQPGPARRALRSWVAPGLPRVERDLVYLLCLATLAEAAALLALEAPDDDDATTAVLLEALDPYAGQVCAGAHGVVTLGAADTHRGMLLLARGDVAAATRALEAGAALEQQMGAPLLLARSRAWLSRSVAAGADAPRAAALREQALRAAAGPRRDGLLETVARVAGDHAPSTRALAGS